MTLIPLILAIPIVGLLCYRLGRLNGKRTTEAKLARVAAAYERLERTQR